MKIKSIVLILVISIVISISFSEFSFVYAELDPVSAMNEAEDPSDASGAEGLGNVINTIIAFIQVIGTGISLIMGTVLGIKYLLAAPSDKADVKKQIMPMIIGAFLLFGAVNIMAIIADFTSELFN